MERSRHSGAKKIVADVDEDGVKKISRADCACDDGRGRVDARMANAGVSEMPGEGANLERQREHLRWKRGGAPSRPYYFERD